MSDRSPVQNEKPDRPRPSARRKRPTFTVAFRVDAYYLTILERGASVFGISVHEYARQRLVELLDRHEETRLLSEATATREAVEALREDIARTLEVLLVNLTQADAAAIRAWIAQSLRRE